MRRIVTIVGARPQFVKAAALSRAFAAWNVGRGSEGFRERIVHTGQHYDENMSKVFFDELEIPRPFVNLGIGSGLHGEQTAAMLAGIEEVLLVEEPDCVLVYGDTNSTLAGALVAAKLGIPVAHVEAGLRSYKPKMPEEINRVLTDRVSSLLFCPTVAAVRCLEKEGIRRGVHRVGDVMYDSVLHNMRLSAESSRIVGKLGLGSKVYCLGTVHRQENTDDVGRLRSIFTAFGRMDLSVVMPVHPRTRKVLLNEGGVPDNVRLIEPVGYLDMLMLVKHARLVLTDSGGLQKEAYWLGVPCVTLREETEWVELVECGANQLAGARTDAILAAVGRVERGEVGTDHSQAPELYGDGRSAERIVKILAGEEGRGAVENGVGLAVRTTHRGKRR